MTVTFYKQCASKDEIKTFSKTFTLVYKVAYDAFTLTEDRLEYVKQKALMNKQWMPITVGILSLIGGIFQSWLSVFFISVFLSAYFGHGGHIPSDPGPIVVFAINTGPLVLTGIPAIIGGIFALRRKRWKLSFVGSILAFLPLLVVFIILTDWRFVHFQDILFYVLVILLGFALPVLAVLSRKQFTKASDKNKGN